MKYEGLGKIPAPWYFTFASTFSVLVILNAGFEIFTGSYWEILGDTLVSRTVNLMALIVGGFLIAGHLWECIMIAYSKIYREIQNEKTRDEVFHDLEQCLKDGLTLEQALVELRRKEELRREAARGFMVKLLEIIASIFRMGL